MLGSRFPCCVFGICHETQQAVGTLYRVYQNVGASISGRNGRFEPFSFAKYPCYMNLVTSCLFHYENGYHICIIFQICFTTSAPYSGVKIDFAPHIKDETWNEDISFQL